MIDSTGREIVSGDIVRIENAYFQRNNAYWIVTNSPGDKDWWGDYHSLTKITRRGKVSYAKYNLSSWPLMCFISDERKAREAREHDKQFARIVVIGHVDVKKDEFEKSNPNRTEYIDWGQALS